MRALMVGLGVLISGCATVHELQRSDGVRTYRLDCGGFVRGWEACDASAVRVCGPDGYDIIARVADARSEARSLLIACAR